MSLQGLVAQDCIADAGEDANYCTGSGSGYRLYLNGGRSTVGSGAPNYQWTVLDDGITISSSQSRRSSPYFAYPQDLESNKSFQIELLVFDNDNSCSDRDTVVITCAANMCPDADAGDDKELSSGCFFETFLDGTDSEDPKGEALTYIWSSLDGYDDLIENENTPLATFTFPQIEQNTLFSFLLSVSDGEYIRKDTSQVYYFKNQPPVADAGKNFETCDYEFRLNGNRSYDPDRNKLTFNWVSLDGLSISEARTIYPKVTSPLDLTSSKSYRVELNLSDGYCQDRDTIIVTIKNNLCPIAIAGDDIRVAKFDSYPVFLDASNSWDPDGSELTYEWQGPNGQMLTEAVIKIDDASPTLPYTKYTYRLKVTDQAGDFGEDSVNVIFSEFSAPISPEIFAVADHNRVLVSWDASSEASYDSLTGYSDFEGYRLYRSTDGGITWGGPDDRLYDYDGNFVGWIPYAQYDFDQSADFNHCVYSHTSCDQGEPRRGESINGLDPLSPRFSLGNDSGIKYAFIDSNVYDGVEYTYTITAYDIGLSPFEISFNQTDSSGIFTSDTIWSGLNPGKFLGPSRLSYFTEGGEFIREVSNSARGYPSLESKKGGKGDKNFITVVPGYIASNISFPDENNMEALFDSDPNNVGTGTRSYFIVDRSKIIQARIKYEIQAEKGEDAIDGMACENPYIFGYEIDDSGNPVSTKISSLSQITPFEKDSISGLPGVIIEGNDLYIPDYTIVNKIGQWTGLTNGIRFKFENDIPLYPYETPEFLADTVEWSNQDGSPLDSISFYTLLYQSGLTFGLQYAPGGSYERRLNIDYKIELFDEPVGDTVQILNLDGLGDMALPLRVTNLKTGKRVGLNCADIGSEEGGFFDTENGASDNTWTRREVIGFRYDTLSVGGVPTESHTFNLRIDFNVPAKIKDYSDQQTYSMGDTVAFGSMMWRAKEAIDGIEPPSNNSNSTIGIKNNPWEVIYPWDKNLAITIKPEKLFVDGDNWVSDMSILGAPDLVEKATMSEIKAVPNPYVVHSKFNETPALRKMRFTHLPQRCQITIFTVSGEVVASISHDERYDGNAWWDLTNLQGASIAPGLYIFTVEPHSDDAVNNTEPFIGKFAVIR